MASGKILIDTSILVDYFRRRDKPRTHLSRLALSHDLAMSAVTEFEFIVGFADKDMEFARELLADVDVLPFDSGCSYAARRIHRELKAFNALIGFPDVMIAATAVVHDLRLATLNMKHFGRVEGLALLKLP